MNSQDKQHDMQLCAKVLTVSDGVAEGSREDSSGQVLVDVLEAAGFKVLDRQVCPDGKQNVKKALKKLAKKKPANQLAEKGCLIVTTGGTGFGPRDLTPEGTKALIEREAHGLHEAMRLVNPLGRLSRGISGTYKGYLILNTPGSPKGAKECLTAVLDILPHALRLLAGHTEH